MDLFHDLGSLDHIVCTAANIDGAYQLLPELDLHAARRVIDSKLIGPILLAKHRAPRLTEGGSITLVSGIAAYRPAARGTVAACEQKSSVLAALAERLPVGRIGTTADIADAMCMQSAAIPGHIAIPFGSDRFIGQINRWIVGY
ncbi:hypothetical protein [Microbulbifer sp. SAOS-129_SWC]|uniref:hypothetical protein n=1 Tax=Microbulbifer sp. SAOS-129_SWC TaxID=3145235 RepID=UPI003216DFAE